MRVTRKDLDYLVTRINEITDSPQEYITTTPNGKFKANIGNYHIEGAYGGVRLSRVSTDGGGITTVSTTGFGTKKELYNWMSAFIAGLTANKRD